jgi:GH15 family glucan-1,4-alpha-glucosidase
VGRWFNPAEMFAPDYAAHPARRLSGGELMRRRIEDWALIGDLQTAALVARDATIVWLCLPRFDSDACFASLLGEERHGRWEIRSTVPLLHAERRYLEDSLVLETTLHAGDGTFRVTDFMPRREELPALVRIVEGLDGNAALDSTIVCRFAYGKIAPWIRRQGDAITLTVGSDAVVLHASQTLLTDGSDPQVRFSLKRGERAWFTLQWYPSQQTPPEAFDPLASLDDTLRFWQGWSGRCRYVGRYRETVLRSLITLKALTYEPTGGTVAAVTTSLPEELGGSKNWDYRYAWLRDSAFTISALLAGGYRDEARAWRDWLLRMIAGSPEQLQIVYSASGDRRLDEYQADWLPGYEDSRPVRIGNAAFQQFQLGVYGHTMDAIVRAHEAGVKIEQSAWKVLFNLLEVIEAKRNQPDSGIWETRGVPKHYTLSRVLVWLAFHRAIRAVQELGYDGPVERWRQIAGEVHAEVCERGYNRSRGAFVQAYESDELDASLLLIPIVGFLPADDPRVAGTIAALERHLFVDGFLQRCSNDPERGGHWEVPTEGAFLACNFWLVECYVLAGRTDEARQLFERLVGIGNDLGLYSEEYDPRRGRLVGNVPQTFSHAALVAAALRLDRL